MDLELFDKLWQLSNTITGFAVAQALVYFYASEKEPIRSQIHSNKKLISTMIVLFHSLYIYAVWWCHSNMLVLVNSKESDNYTEILYGIQVGQQSFIALLGLSALSITLLNQNSKNKG